MVGATSITSGGVQTVRSLTEYEAKFGVRSGGALAYDSADAFFREGGARLTVSPIGGVAAPDLSAALDLLTKDMGPGQVFSGAAADDADNVLLLDHAAATNRVAIMSAPDGDATALEASAAALSSEANARYGALFAPSATIPGLAAGTTRHVPYAAIEAGIIARNDGSFNANVPAAGVNGQALYALDLEARYTDQEYEDLNLAGVDMARIVYDGVRTYGYRSVVDPSGPDGVWLDFGNVRLNMGIVAKAEAIGENYVFTQLDGRRRTISQFGGELRAMLVPYYEAGALYGETADEAFYVDVGSSINTEETIANGELHAVIEVRMSPFAELVVIEIVKVATTQAIAA
jgi:phage tail sheath protein FI